VLSKFAVSSLVRCTVLGCLFALLAGVGSRAIAQDASAADPFLWLEEMNGARALDWVKAENAKTLAVLKQDPHFADFYSANLKIGQARDRIPAPQIINGRIYNFWQDADHVRGIWRATPFEDYLRPEPAWKTILDLDALAKTENKNWVWRGASCESPSRTTCLIRLSDGGEDAVTLREFDLTSASFVAGGFSLPRGKQSAAWVDNDTLLVSREWEPGMLTASGYAYDVKLLKRGQPLSAAVEVYSGIKSDVSVSAGQLGDGRGHRAVMIDRGVSFFQSEERVLTPAGPRKLDLPLKALRAASRGRSRAHSPRRAVEKQRRHLPRRRRRLARFRRDDERPRTSSRDARLPARCARRLRWSDGDARPTACDDARERQGARRNLHAGRRRRLDCSPAGSAGQLGDRAGKRRPLRDARIRQRHGILESDDFVSRRYLHRRDDRGETRARTFRCVGG